MVRRLLSGFLVVVALVACVEAEVSNQSSAGAEPQSKTGPEAGVTDSPGAVAGEGVEEQEELAEEVAGEQDLLLVTGSGGEVTVMRPDGTPVRALRASTGIGGPSPQPTWAPVSLNGRHRVAWTELAEDGTFHIALADVVDGSMTRHESPIAPFYYYWSPDATLLGFLGQNAFSPLQMGVVDVQRDTLELVGEGRPFYFDWRADSKAMVTHVGDVLSLLTRDDEVWSTEVLPVRPGLFQAPAWISPDRILVTTFNSPGGVEVSMRAIPGVQGDPSGQRLVVSDLDGRSISTLVDLEGAAAFEPDPDGSRVAFTDFDGPLMVLDMAEGVSAPVSEGRVAAFQWSPDGSRLLLMEVDPEAQLLVPKVWDGSDTLVFPPFFPTRVFLLQYLPFWDQYSRSLTLWAPSGEAFTHPAANADGDRIMVQHLSEAGPIQISRGVFASWSPSPVSVAPQPQSGP